MLEDSGNYGYIHITVVACILYDIGLCYEIS